MHDSTMFTIGTALRRAEGNHLPVEVLVHGHWLRGNVAGLDGHGLVLSTHAEHSVVRLERSRRAHPGDVEDAPVAETFDEHAPRAGGRECGRPPEDDGLTLRRPVLQRDGVLRSRSRRAGQPVRGRARHARRWR